LAADEKNEFRDINPAREPKQKMKTSKTISTGDFFTGFFSALAARDEKEQLRCGDRFDEAMEEAFNSFAEKCKKEGIETSFLIMRDPLHGDSSVVKEGLAAAIRRDLISLDNPSFQKISLKINGEVANALLDGLPGGKALYEQLADEFLIRYRSNKAVA
jgi:hypothetical protein